MYATLLKTHFESALKSSSLTSLKKEMVPKYQKIPIWKNDGYLVVREREDVIGSPLRESCSPIPRNQVLQTFSRPISTGSKAGSYR